MTVTDLPVTPWPGDGAGPGPQERAWDAAEAVAVAVMGAVNAGVARLVGAVRDLLAVDGWEGAGIRSPEHWVTWKAGVSHARASGLVRIARRAGELPACWALFETGRLSEDAMVRIARRVPAARDAEVAALAPQLLISQLDRLLRALPDQPDGAPTRSDPEPERTLRLRDGRDGWLHGEFSLPADEGALVRLGLLAARDAELHDHHPDIHTNTDSDTGAPAAGRPTAWYAWPPRRPTPSTRPWPAPANAANATSSCSTSTSTPAAPSDPPSSSSAP